MLSATERGRLLEQVGAVRRDAAAAYGAAGGRGRAGEDQVGAGADLGERVGLVSRCHQVEGVAPAWGDDLGQALVVGPRQDPEYDTAVARAMGLKVVLHRRLGVSRRD